MEKAPFEGWAILELMGHRRLAGYVSEQEMAGTVMLRIDVPGDGGGEGQVAATQFYGGASIYCLTPTTEEVAKKVARGSQPAPVQRWELRDDRTLPASSHHLEDDDDDEGYSDAELQGAGEPEDDDVAHHSA